MTEKAKESIKAIRKAYEYLTWNQSKLNEEISKLEKQVADEKMNVSEKTLEWLLYLKILRSKKYE